MPQVARLSIAPVRGLGLQHPPSIELTEMGVVTDRRFYLVDERGRLVDRLLSGELVMVSAETNDEATWLKLAFPDGSAIEGEVHLHEPVQTDIYGRLALGHVVGGPWAAALEPYAHRRVLLVRCDRPGGTRIRPGETNVRNAVSLVSDGSLQELAAQLEVPDVDGRRFRMLIELEGARAHVEDTWIGEEVAIGSAVLHITKPDARCAITTQDPDTGARDLDTLRTIIRYRGFRAGDPERKIDFGVLGEVHRPGTVSIGDEVAVAGFADIEDEGPIEQPESVIA